MSHRLILRTVLAAALAALLGLPAAAATSTWQIDPAHASAQFAVRHLTISNVRGEFHKITGVVQLDDKDVTKSSVEVSIDATTVDTREPDRDKDLRSANFFEVEKYPTITFKSKRVEQTAPSKLKVTGDLTIHGVTREVVLDVDGPSAPIKDPWGFLRCAVTATTKINRQDFGVRWNGKLDNGGVLIGDEVTITIDVEMIRKPPAASGY